MIKTMQWLAPMSRCWRVTIVASGLFLGLACSSNTTGGDAGSGAGGSGAGGGGAGGGGMGDPNVLAGTFQVKLIEPVPAMNGNPETPGQTSVLGKVYDGATPSQIIWEEAAKEGACRLVTPRVPFCSTPCGGSAVCVEDETCAPYPLAHSAGTVAVRGVKTEAGASEFTLTAVSNAYQVGGGTKLVYPGFAEGDEISVSASGDFYSPFSVTSSGIAPLDFLDDTITLTSGQPVTLHWTAATKANNSKIHVKLDISHHGGTKGMLECDTDDTGSLDLPAALVQKLLDLGVAGYPTIIVTRSATGSVTIAPGRVDLVVSSDVERSVIIPGVTSCLGDTDCPQGQTCQNDLTCK